MSRRVHASGCKAVSFHFDLSQGRYVSTDNWRIHDLGPAFRFQLLDVKSSSPIGADL